MTFLKRKENTNIIEFTRAQLVAWLTEQGIALYRADQILKWIYLRQADSFNLMTDLSKDIRRLLVQHFVIGRLEVDKIETSRDGSRKYLFKLSDGKHIESVLIPEGDHYTLCVSSQVGCAQGCLFCLTATGGFERNLTRAEIIAQVRDIKNELENPEQLRNIVFMGMGEPLANYKNLVSALDTLTDNDAGLRFATRRITVSTAGLVPKFAALGRDTKVNLAISLNAIDNDTRSRLMPINRVYPLESLLKACRQYPLPAGRRITFEYILLKGINDSESHARRLVKLLQPIRCKLNLIPFNPHEGCDFKRPAESVIQAFYDILFAKNYTVIIRRSKGQDISAACGQLRARSAGRGA
ncbi:MAG: 23S rRNA (adenine(2503)-C(2))-methyltransferase RlmN [Deltaproteobacteria bacterium]|jgi:23S rRNA (adenine2503-C2)-methyltransferase|nr:23S rRNA (adenine(2503)-C(2))-methyltransferase RlmN [Deltaproteobacteria bacterium]